MKCFWFWQQRTICYQSRNLLWHHVDRNGIALKRRINTIKETNHLRTGISFSFINGIGIDQNGIGIGIEYWVTTRLMYWYWCWPNIGQMLSIFEKRYWENFTLKTMNICALSIVILLYMSISRNAPKFKSISGRFYVAPFLELWVFTKYYIQMGSIGIETLGIGYEINTVGIDIGIEKLPRYWFWYWFRSPKYWNCGIGNSIGITIPVWQNVLLDLLKSLCSCLINWLILG